jgi:hypothetical protein
MKAKYLDQVLILLLIILIFDSGTSFATGSWMTVINEKEKLWGVILLRHDVDPPCWKEADLPEGWRRIFNTHKFPDYIDLGQILPKKRNGMIFFAVSIYNLKTHLNKEG